MRPLKLSLGGPDISIPGLLGPWISAAVPPGVAAPVAREVTREVVAEAQPLVQETARSAAREVWASMPKAVIVGGAVAVGALVLMAVRGR